MKGIGSKFASNKLSSLLFTRLCIGSIRSKYMENASDKGQTSGKLKQNFN